VTARERRTVRLGLLATALILLYVLALDPYLTARAKTRDLIEKQQAQLTRQVALDRSLPIYRRRLQAAQATWDTEVQPRLLAGDVPAVAASTLSNEVRRIAAQSFLDVERENVLAAAEKDGLTAIPVQFSLRGDIYGLRDFLAALESTRTFLNLRELRVTAITGGFNQVLPVTAAPLQITVTVEGYLGGAPVAGEPAAATQPPGAGAPAGAEGASEAPNAPAAEPAPASSTEPAPRSGAAAPAEPSTEGTAPQPSPAPPAGLGGAPERPAGTPAGADLRRIPGGGVPAPAPGDERR
jgi:hypothetical protein